MAEPGATCLSLASPNLHASALKSPPKGEPVKPQMPHPQTLIEAEPRFTTPPSLPPPHSHPTVWPWVCRVPSGPVGTTLAPRSPLRLVADVHPGTLRTKRAGPATTVALAEGDVAPPAQQVALHVEGAVEPCSKNKTHCRFSPPSHLPSREILSWFWFERQGDGRSEGRNPPGTRGD